MAEQAVWSLGDGGDGSGNKPPPPGRHEEDKAARGDGGGSSGPPSGGNNPPPPRLAGFPTVAPRQMMWVQFAKGGDQTLQAKRRLHDLDVHFISLVADPANQKQFLTKSAGADDAVVVRMVKILKANTVKQMVYGIVYAPDEVDTEGDTMTAEEIEKASYRFMQKSRTPKIDTDHSYVEGAGFVAESWLVRKDDALFPDEPEGAWAVGIKVTDAPTWDRVVKGELTGLSLAGLSKYEQLVDETEAQGEDLAKAFAERVKKHLGLGKAATTTAEKGSFKERLFQNQIWRITEALGDAVREILRDDAITDKVTAVRAVLTEFDAFLVAELGEVTAKTSQKVEVREPADAPSEPEAGASSHAEIEALKAQLAKQAEQIETQATQLAALEQTTPGRQSVLGQEAVQKKGSGKGYKGLRIQF